MHFSTFLPLLPLVASAAQIKIDVGEDGLKFSPSTVQAAVGDQLVFSFYPKKHSVTQSSFQAPCQALSGGINSGFVPSSSGVGGTFTVTVNNTSPMWLYCAQTTGAHCQNGMSMVVNQASSGPNTLAAYQAASKNAANATIGNAVTGGVLATNSSSGGSGSTSTSAGGSSPTASSTASSSPIASASSAAAPAGAVGWAVLGGAAALGGLLI